MQNFPLPLEKHVGHSLKLFGIVKKIWATLRKLFAPWCPKLVTGLGSSPMIYQNESKTFSKS